MMSKKTSRKENLSSIRTWCGNNFLNNLRSNRFLFEQY